MKQAPKIPTDFDFPISDPKKRPEIPKMSGSLAIVFRFVLIAAFPALHLTAETLPADRTAPWQIAGIPGGIPEYANGVKVSSFGAVGDGVADDTSAIRKAIAACPVGKAVYFHDGTYRLTETLRISKGIALRGESRMSTILKMDHTADGIFLGTYEGSSPEYTITGGMEKGNKTLSLASINNSKFVPGRVVEIIQDNDPEVFEIGSKGDEGWLPRQTGMVNEIVSVEGKTVTLRLPLLLDYSSKFNPTLRAQKGVVGAGIENLTILRSDDNTSGTGNNIVLNAAVRSWVKDIWSEKTYSHHIRLMRSQQCELRGNIMNDAWRNSGGRGYGISVQERSTLNLIEDNAGNHLRHSYNVQMGATANVFGYNFSKDPYSDDSPEWVFADLLAHGSMANFTLWEGNKVARIDMDNIHGSNPWNTAFRNFATRPKSRFPGAIVGETSKWCSLIGNVLGTTASGGLALEIHSNVAKTTINNGNLNGNAGVCQWAPETGTDLPASFYRNEKPAFLGDKGWPVFGPTIGAPDTLPAEDRWYSLSGTTRAAGAPVAIKPAAAPPKTDLNPVARYDCENPGRNTLHDKSGNMLEGVIKGATFTPGSHDESESISFNGKDRVIIGHQPVLDITAAITIAAWVKTSDATRDQCILSKNNAFYLYLVGSPAGAKIRVGLRMNRKWVTYTTPSENLISNDTWSHVAVTYDGTEVKVYVNDILTGKSPRTGAIDTSSKSLELGTMWNANYLKGSLDDILLFDRALHAEEIHSVFTGEWRD